MRVNRRRSDIEIIADMLKVGENGAGKTEIMYSANMSYAQIQKYLGYLIGQGFVDKFKTSYLYSSAMSAAICSHNISKALISLP